jgi:type IV pilus assembly protein PilW
MIELMIAMVLSSIVIYGAISMFMASRGTSQTTTAVGDVTDSGRVALDVIGESVRSGGAMACNALNDVRGVVINSNTQLAQSSILNAGASPLQLDYLDAFSGFEAVSTAPGNAFAAAAAPVVADGASNDWAGNAGTLDGLLIGRVIKNSDVLAVRESVPESSPVYTNAQYVGNVGGTTISVNTVGSLQPGEYAVISDCTTSVAFQIGLVNAAAGTITTNGPLSVGGGDLRWTFPAPSSITPINMAVYYIGVGRDKDSSLFKYDEWTGQFQELVPDVENMQVLYGVASSSPDQITQYVTADQVVNFNQVVDVRVALLVASPPGVLATPTPSVAQTYQLLDATVTAPRDQRLRKVFETTIAVQNAAL